MRIVCCCEGSIFTNLLTFIYATYFVKEMSVGNKWHPNHIITPIQSSDLGWQVGMMVYPVRIFRGFRSFLRISISKQDTKRHRIV